MNEHDSPSLEQHSPDSLFFQVYDELRRLAASKLKSERGNHTLQATALVHEAFIRLGGEQFTNRQDFFRAAAEAMRRILIDHARAKGAQKRGGKHARVLLDEIPIHDATIDLR